VSAELEERLQRLGAQMLDEAPPVTAAEAVRHRLRLPDVQSSNGAPIDVDASADGPTTIPLSPRTRRIGQRGGRMLAGLVAAASLLILGLGVVTSGIGDDERRQQVVGAPETAQAQAANEPTTSAPAPTTSAAAVPAGPEQLHWPPRILLDTHWDVVTANERSANEGYITFERAGATVFVGWYRDDGIDEEWHEGNGFTAVGSGTLLGHPVTMYSGPLAYHVADIEDLIDLGVLPPDVLGESPPSLPEAPSTEPETQADDLGLIGGPILEEQLGEAIAAGQIEGVRTQGLETSLVVEGASLSVQVMTGDPETTLTAEEFAALLASVRQVETAEWEAALPQRVVTPAQRAAALDEMLTDVVVPEGFDPRIIGENLTQDRVELAGTAANRVVCAWLDRFFTAPEGSPEAAEALDAISSIPSWPVTAEIEDAAANPIEGYIPSGSANIPSLRVNDDGTITYEGTGEVLDGHFAAMLCDSNAQG
jgi:hypothetical protein